MRRIALVVSALALLVLACDRSPAQPQPEPEPQPAASGWTILVYMLADSEIESDAIENLGEMAAVGSGDGFKLVVQVERAGRVPAPIGTIPAPTSSDTKRLLVERGGFSVLADLGNVDHGTPAALADFIGWGVEAYPAKRYALVLWDHGGAWLGGFGKDASHGNSSLSIAEIVEGLAGGLQRAGLSRFDLIGMDACLMGAFEVAEALKGKADYLLASEELERGPGWEYHALEPVKANPDLDAVTLGRFLADGYLRSQPDVAILTLSLVDLNQLSALEAALAAAAGLATQIPDHVSEMGAARGETLQFDGGRDGQLDLGNFWARLAARIPAWDGVNQQIAAGLAGAVVYQVRGAAAQTATGLSIYFPPNADVFDAPIKPFETVTAGQIYRSLPGIESWRGFVEAYVGTVPPPSMPSFANDHVATVQPYSRGWIVSGLLTPGSYRWVTEKKLHAGFEVPGSDVDPAYHALYLERTAAVTAQELNPTPDGTADVNATWDGTIPRLEQGSTFTYGYASVLDVDPVRRLAVIPLAYLAAPTADCATAPEAYWWVVLLGDTIESSEVFMAQDGRVAALPPAPGSRFAARYLRSYRMSENWECSPETFDATIGMGLDFVKPGTSEFLGTAQRYARLEVRGPSGRIDFAEVIWP